MMMQQQTCPHKNCGHRWVVRVAPHPFARCPRCGRHLLAAEKRNPKRKDKR